MRNRDKRRGDWHWHKTHPINQSKQSHSNQLKPASWETGENETEVKGSQVKGWFTNVSRQCNSKYLRQLSSAENKRKTMKIKVLFSKEPQNPSQCCRFIILRLQVWAEVASGVKRNVTFFMWVHLLWRALQKRAAETKNTIVNLS